MEFKYSLYGEGWAEGYIEVNSQRCEFNPSYLTDVLGDLLDGLVYLITVAPKRKNKDQKTFTFDWDEEPNGLEWTFTLLEEKKMALSIKSFEDISSKESEQGEVLIETTCNINEFLSEVIKALDLLIKRHGIIGYKETWNNHEFPLSDFLRLKHYLKQKNDININYVGENKRLGGYYSTDLNYELSLLGDIDN